MRAQQAIRRALFKGVGAPAGYSWLTLNGQFLTLNGQRLMQRTPS